MGFEFVACSDYPLEVVAAHQLLAVGASETALDRGYSSGRCTAVHEQVSNILPARQQRDLQGRKSLRILDLQVSSGLNQGSGDLGRGVLCVCTYGNGHKLVVCVYIIEGLDCVHVVSDFGGLRGPTIFCYLVVTLASDVQEGSVTIGVLLVHVGTGSDRGGDSVLYMSGSREQEHTHNICHHQAAGRAISIRG